MPRFGKRADYQDINGEENVVFTDDARRLRVRKRQCLCIGLSGFAIIVLVISAVTLWIVLPSNSSDSTNSTSLAYSDRETKHFNCIPEGGKTETKETCEKRGCCWNGSRSDTGSPQCFYPDGFGYALDGPVENTTTGTRINVKRKAGQPSQYGGDIDTVRVDIYYETPYRLRIKLTDPHKSRYEVPIPTPQPPQKKASNPLYSVTVSEKTFNFTVKRTSKSRDVDIFSSTTGLIFSDQFLQLTGIIPSHNIYGLGEHVKDRFKLQTNYSVLTLFARDQPPSPDKPNQNLYGVHPFYLCVETDGNAHGVFLLNSNAMEIELGPLPSVTYRTIGGILDFYFFLGPSPEAVVQQYTAVVGRSFMPPYWSLGFHLCRWGYLTANRTLDVVKRMRAREIPQDTQWNDIDYMSSHLDFTYNHTSFAELPKLVANLHEHGQHYVVITDPGISNQQPKGKYPPYDDGVAMGIFIKNTTNEPLIGEVWPGSVAFPDFTNPYTETYWKKFVSEFHTNISFDGLWIDMNEPSNFVPGSIDGCPDNTINRPPFLPGIYHEEIDKNISLFTKTLCMSAHQNISTHYNVHSLYGHGEANHTMLALEKVIGNRSLVISRSTYPGSGQYGGHWLGDNESLYRHMANSITGILDFSLFGIPLVGADICGFGGNTTEQLCTRWMQLGAFYPFSRNHNIKGSIAQDPAALNFSEKSINSSRDVLFVRYQLLPYLYTLFHFAHVNGCTVARPLLFEFPSDKDTWNVDTQFMWGGDILVTPVLIENATTVSGYFPAGVRWFELSSGRELNTSGHVTLSANLSFIPLHVRGGAIIAMQQPNTTTTESRKNPFGLMVALDDDQSGEGWLFWDDGESLRTYEDGKYSLLHFVVQNDSLTSSLQHSGYSRLDTATLNVIKVYGFPRQPKSLSLNGTEVPNNDVEWNGDTKVLIVTVSVRNLNRPFKLTWKFS